MSASLDRSQMSLNEQAVLSLTVAGSATDLPQPQLPPLDGFQVYNAGKAQNFSWVNGQASASVTYSYVLTPLREGQFTIPPIQLEYQGQRAATPAMNLQVVAGQANAVPAPPRAGVTRAQAGATPGIFITGTANKTSVYPGEPVIFSFRLYNRIPLLSRPNYQPPETTGFWAEDLPPQRNYTESVRGIPYNVTEVRTALFPTAAGRAKIGPATLQVHIENLGSDPFGSDFFLQFFGRAEEKVLRTDPISISVKALPDPKPAGFKGAVGKYAIAASLDKQKSAVGQPLTLTVTVSGTGNIKSLPDVEWPAFTNFRTFDANAATNIEKKDGAVQGSKVFKTVLIPTASGTLSIPPVSYVYFDPAARAYRTLSTQSLNVQIDAGATSSASPAPGAVVPATSAAPGIRRLGEDIHYIKTPKSIHSQARPLVEQPWFRWLHGVFFFGLFAGALAKLYHRLFLSNVPLARFRGARARVKEATKEADAAMERAEIKKAAGALANGLRGYLADKLAWHDRHFGLKEAIAELKNRGVLHHSAEKLRNLWETLDLYQFAPSQVKPQEMQNTMRTMEHVLDELEGEIQWKG